MKRLLVGPFNRVEGDLEVETVLHHPHRASQVVASERVTAFERGVHRLAPVALAELGDGLAFLRLRARSASVFAGGAVVADRAAPAAEVNLGIRYNDLEATGLDEERFVIGRLDIPTGTWRPMEKRGNDPSSNYTSATISEPGFYMVWEARQPISRP